MFTKCQLLIIANIFLCFPHGIKINDFWEWGGDTSNSDNRAFYKFLQRKHRQIRSNLFLWRRNMAILWTCFFLLSKDFPFYIKYHMQLKKKKIHYHLSWLHSNVYFQRDISYSVFTPVFHGINMKLLMNQPFWSKCLDQSLDLSGWQEEFLWKY